MPNQTETPVLVPETNPSQTTQVVSSLANTPNPPETVPSVPKPKENPKSQKNGSKTKLPIGVLVIIFLVMVAGLYFLNKNNSTSTSSNQTSSKTTTSSGTDNSSLDSATQSINSDLNSLSTYESNADKGLNDQASNLTY